MPQYIQYERRHLQRFLRIYSNNNIGVDTLKNFQVVSTGVSGKIYSIYLNFCHN